MENNPEPTYLDKALDELDRLANRYAKEATIEAMKLTAKRDGHNEALKDFRGILNFLKRREEQGNEKA